MAGQNMGDMINRHVPELNEQKPDMQVDTNTIRQATGLNVTHVNNEAPKTPSFEEYLTPEEAAQLGFGGGEKIDVDKEASDATDRKLAAAKAESDNKLLSMIDDAIANEDERFAAMDARMSTEEGRKEIFQNETGTPNNAGGTVQYISEYSDSDAPKNEPIFAPREKLSMDTPDPDELVPSYDFEEEVETPKATEEDEAEPRPDFGTSEYQEYVQGLKVGTDQLVEPVLEVRREKVDTIQVIDSGRNSKSKILADQAFLNSVTKFKKDNFRTVKVPLVNSGFFVDVVGTGAVDIVQLYDQVNDQTASMDYELEKMKIIIRNIVDTEPKIDKNQLRNMIHSTDYQMLAYAHLAATLSTVELVHSCTDCGRDFRITAKTSDLLLNRDEIEQKKNEIRAANSLETVSLMEHNRKIVTPDGFTIVLGHPSYAEAVQYLAELRAITQNLSQGQVQRIGQMVDILSFVRSVTMPNGVITNNLYQRYIALTLLTESSYDNMSKTIDKMAEEVIAPKFGVRKITCPHCGKTNTDISYTSLNDLLFFHITVSRLLKNVAQ